jgi:hypothetical protein
MEGSVENFPGKIAADSVARFRQAGFQIAFKDFAPGARRDFSIAGSPPYAVFYAQCVRRHHMKWLGLLGQLVAAAVDRWGER